MPGVLALLDVDHFKIINDSHGHAVGDEVLVALAQRLSGALRADDLLVRWGGEEFFVYVVGKHDIKAMAKRLLEQVGNAPVATGAGQLAVQVSVGLIALPENAVAEDSPLTMYWCSLTVRCVHHLRERRSRPPVDAKQQLAGNLTVWMAELGGGTTCQGCQQLAHAGTAVNASL